jgi:hypothetical protein
MDEMSNQLLERIALALESLVQASAPAEPNYRYPLAEYGRFDWPRIGAQVIASDRFGASAVQWNGHTWTRRSGDGKFGRAIWFSRPNGQDEDGTQYLRLVTFKDLSEAEPLPEGVSRDLRAAGQTGKPAGDNGRKVDRVTGEITGKQPDWKADEAAYLTMASNAKALTDLANNIAKAGVGYATAQDVVSTLVKEYNKAHNITGEFRFTEKGARKYADWLVDRLAVKTE